MSHRKIAAILLSILAAIPAAYAKDRRRAPLPERRGSRSLVPCRNRRLRQSAKRHRTGCGCATLPRVRTNLQVHMCAEKYRSHKTLSINARNAGDVPAWARFSVATGPVRREGV